MEANIKINTRKNIFIYRLTVLPGAVNIKDLHEINVNISRKRSKSVYKNRRPVSLVHAEKERAILLLGPNP